MTKGQRIKYKREELNISQTDLANQIGVSKQTLYKYENDIITNIPSDIIEKLSLKLNVSPAYIMGWEFAVDYNPEKDISDRIMSYAKRISQLSPENQDAVSKYIDFLSDQ